MNLTTQSWHPKDLNPELRRTIDDLKQGPQDEICKANEEDQTQ